MQKGTSLTRKDGRILSSFSLKIIALIAMTIDHIAIVLLKNDSYDLAEFDGYEIMRSIGRIAFPLYCFLLIEGVHYSKNKRSYLFRMLVFGAISQMPYSFAVHGEFFQLVELNIYFTLALGLLMCLCIDYLLLKYQSTQEQKKIYVFAIFVVFACCAQLADEIRMQYGKLGIVYILLFYFCYYPVKNDECDILLLVYRLILFLLLGFATYKYDDWPLQIYAIAAVGVILLYNGDKGRKTWKYFFYAYYPLHFLILGLLKMIVLPKK